MAITPISGVTDVAFLPGIGAVRAGEGASTFGASLAAAVDGLAAGQERVSDLAVKAVTGRLDDIHDFTIAATEAQVALELTVAVRNKAVDAFNEIMRMQA